MDRKFAFTVAGVLLATAAIAGGETASPAGRITSGAEAEIPVLEPWEPVDPAFNGCSEGVCGRRGRNPEAVAQPGAKIGQYVYCPVSGAVFQAKESSRRVDLDGKPLYPCCEACARYFAAKRDRVLALRGLVSRGSFRELTGGLE